MSCSSKNNGCGFKGPAHCCVRRNKFVEEQALDAFNSLDNTGLQCAQRVELPGPSAGNTSDFGRNLALSRDGSVLVVAKRDFTTDQANNVGAVYVFERNTIRGFCVNNEKKFALRQIIVPPEEDQTASLLFGNSVAISADGSRIVVGAPADTPSSNEDAAVYVYDRFSLDRCGCAPQWHLVQKLKAQKFETVETDCGCENEIVVDDLNALTFGFSLVLSANGRVVVVQGSAIENETNSAVYIYESPCHSFGVAPPCLADGEGPFRFVQRITIEQFNNVCDPPLTNPTIGSALAVDETGDRIAISAMQATTEKGFGLVQIYRRKGKQSCWLFAQRLIPNIEASFYGVALAITPSGQFLVVESRQPETGSIINNRGFITVYRETAQQLCKTVYVQDGKEIETQSGENDSIFLLQQLAISDDGCLLAVGWESTATVSSVSNAGQVDIYERDCLAQNNDLSRESFVLKQELVRDVATPDSLFGVALALSGDATTLAVGRVDGNVQTYFSKKCALPKNK